MSSYHVVFSFLSCISLSTDDTSDETHIIFHLSGITTRCFCPHCVFEFFLTTKLLAGKIALKRLPRELMKERT